MDWFKGIPTLSRTIESISDVVKESTIPTPSSATSTGTSLSRNVFPLFFLNSNLYFFCWLEVGFSLGIWMLLL